METKQNKNAEAFKITGNWATQSKQLKEEYPQLTDADLKFEQGKENELLSRLETKLNKSREDVITLLQKYQLAGV